MAENVDDEVVVLDAAAIVMEDEVECLDVGDGEDDEAGLFEDFADAGFASGLSELNGTAGERPTARHGIGAAADEEYLGGAVGASEDNGSDAGDGAIGVGTAGRLSSRGLGWNVHAGYLSLRFFPYSSPKTVWEVSKRPPSNLSGPLRCPIARRETTQ